MLKPIGIIHTPYKEPKGIPIQVTIVEAKDVDGPPLLDIKPYIPAFDTRVADRTGWLGAKGYAAPSCKDEGRFVGGKAGGS